METETLLQSAECTNINLLYKLNRWEFGFKLDIPEFNGGLQPEEFLDWIAAVEEVFDFEGVLKD
jgi:hypothetical protein